jgi:hypothetical protein
MELDEGTAELSRTPDTRRRQDFGRQGQGEQAHTTCDEGTQPNSDRLIRSHAAVRQFSSAALPPPDGAVRPSHPTAL